MTADPGAAMARIREVGIVPVIRADAEADAIRIAETLIGAGLSIVEITMTVPNAISAMSAVARRFGGDVTLGAGTITSRRMADAAVEAGCRFLVTPCLLPELILTRQTRAVPVICGTLTPTEIFLAHRAGVDMVKVFPAGNVGGPEYIRSLRGPFPDIPLMATGGVSLDTIDRYFAAGVDAVGVGGELISRAAVKAGNFAAIAANAEAFVDAAKQARTVR